MNALIDNFPQILRTRTVALLKEINTLAGAYVDDSRVAGVDAADAPRVLVWLMDRAYTWIGDAAPEYDSTGELIVEGYVTGASLVVVTAQAETLGEQILLLMRYQGFLAPPLTRVKAIDVTFNIDGEGDRYEARVIAKFTMQWTERFEPLLAPFTGTAAPGAYGAPFQLIEIEETTADGDVLTGATIVVSSI